MLHTEQNGSFLIVKLAAQRLQTYIYEWICVHIFSFATSKKFDYVRLPFSTFDQSYCGNVRAHLHSVSILIKSCMYKTPQKHECNVTYDF